MDQKLAQDIIEIAKKEGADAADLLLVKDADHSVRVRLGKSELIESSESTGIGLRVLIHSKDGYRQAILSGSDLSKEAVEDMAEKAVAMARIAPADPHISLAEKGEYCTQEKPLDLFDASTPLTVDELIAQAIMAEATGLDYQGVSNSDGVEYSQGYSESILASSHGLMQHSRGSATSFSASFIAGKGAHMETDYDYQTVRHYNDLPPIHLLAESAAERAVKRLNPKQAKGGKMPVIFSPRVARSYLGNFTSAINGASVAKGTSFLKHAMNEQIFTQTVTIFDDPHIMRGLASQSCDAEGIEGAKRTLVENGTLQSWILDLRAANKLGLKSTGHASRGLASSPSPSPSNVWMQAGDDSPEALIEDIKNGFYVDECFGMGINMVTGDYSQGAAGFWIENGKITHPVSEMTIAGNLKDMFLNTVPANDLTMKHSINCPTLLIKQMSVAGA